MPVSFKVADHPANPVPGHVPANTKMQEYTSLLVHRRAPSRPQTLVNSPFIQAKPILKVEASPAATPPASAATSTVPAPFNFYVNANAELLRASFVAHEGKQELKARTQASRHTMDFGAMSRQMVGLLAKVIIDPTLREWVMPDFSTTTLNDKTVGAIVMMSTLKAYFEYTFEQCECGIPRKLKEYGLQTTAWYHLLVPVIKRFVAAFDSPDSAANVDFWQKPSQSSVAPEVLSAKEFWAHYAKPGVLNHNGYIKLCLDDTPFHRIESINIPSGYVEVPVKLKAEGTDVSDPCTMIAGVVGTLASVSEDTGFPSKTT
ncbi:hypothetical protein B0H13DRAFT_2352524 [Mycena leptocephala]|nr:hypothetical protein B0H13DRAFT_2352524 [Mycena leptocephala]